MKNKQKFSKEKEDLIISSFNKLKSVRATSKKLNICKSSITNVLKRNNIKIISFSEQCGITEELKEEIIKSYEVYKNCTKMSKIFGVSKQTICNILKEAGFIIFNRKEVLKKEYKHRLLKRDNYFEKIDTEDKAYFLGLLYADGSINKNGITISLQEDDLHILEYFKNKLDLTNNLYFVKKQDDNHKNQYCLSVYSSKLSKDIINKGCIPNKTMTLKFPTEEQVPNHFIHHFIRGYFDGDGCISLQKDGKYIFNICGTEQFIIKLQEILIKECNLNKTNIRKPKKKTGNDITSVLVYSGNRQLLKIRDWLYKDATVYFHRKKDKFFNIKKVWKT